MIAIFRIWTFDDPGWRRGTAVRVGPLVAHLWHERKNPRRFYLYRRPRFLNTNRDLFPRPFIALEVFGRIATLEVGR